MIKNICLNETGIWAHNASSLALTQLSMYLEQILLNSGGTRNFCEGHHQMHFWGGKNPKICQKCNFFSSRGMGKWGQSLWHRGECPYVPPPLDAPTPQVFTWFTSFTSTFGQDSSPWQKCYPTIHHSFLHNWKGKAKKKREVCLWTFWQKSKVPRSFFFFFLEKRLFSMRFFFFCFCFFGMLCSLCTKILNHNPGSQYTKYHTYTVIQVFFHFFWATETQSTMPTGCVETALRAVVRRQYPTMSSIRPGPVRFRRKEKGKKKSQRIALRANFDFKSYVHGVQRQTSFFFGLNAWKRQRFTLN